MKEKKLRSDESFQCPECGYWAVREGNRKRIPHSKEYTRTFRCDCGYRKDLPDDEEIGQGNFK